MSAQEYFPDETEGLTPSEKAWDTAKKKAVERAQSPFHKQNDEEIRALCDENLPPGAVRLFLLIAKLSWLPKFGGLFKGRIGSIAISARYLAKLCHSNVKSFYQSKQKRRAAPKEGEEKAQWIQTGKTQGWIELLEARGYLWVSKHRIKNIPENKAQNVYNLCCFVTRSYTPELPLLGGDELGEGTVPLNGNSDLTAGEGSETEENPINGTGSAPKGAQAVPLNGNGQLPKTGTGNAPKGERAITLNGNSALPLHHTAHAPKGERAVPLNGNSPLVEKGHGQDGLMGQPRKLKADKAVKEDSLSPINRLDNRLESGPEETENDFLEACLAVFGEHEMRHVRNPQGGKGNGGLWRVLYKNDSAMAWSVIREVRTMKREGRIKTTAAKTAMDLWKRWRSEKARAAV